MHILQKNIKTKDVGFHPRILEKEEQYKPKERRSNKLKADINEF